MIKNLRVVNFKAFQDQQLKLAPLTILTGLNGSGKSSLMQAVLLIRQAFESGSYRRNVIAINGDYVRLGTPADVRNESLGDDEVSFHFGFEDGDAIDVAFSFGADERVTQLICDPDHIPKDGLFDRDFIFLAADRISPQVYYAVPDGFTSSGRLGIHGERTAHYLAQFGDARISILDAAHPKAKSTQLIRQVEAWLGEVSPGVQIHSDSQSALDVVSLAYSFVSRRDVSKQYRATNVGFGVTYVLPVLTALLSAKPGDLLLIESPEAHLHPRGQSKLGGLISLISQSGVQIIVETHSDHLLNGVRVAVHQNQLESQKVVALYFRWNPTIDQLATTVESILIDEHGRIAYWPEGFFDEFDKSLDVLLTAKPRR